MDQSTDYFDYLQDYCKYLKMNGMESAEVQHGRDKRI